MGRFQTLAGVTMFLIAGAARADGVAESNYLHIDPATAITVDGVFTKKNVSGGSYRIGGVQIGRAFRISPKGRLVIGPGENVNDTETIVLRFDEDICVIGVKVRIDTGGRRNSIRVAFSFVASDGTLVDREIRFPAGGTTLQSFSSISFSDRFRGVKIDADANSGLAIGGIKALRCAQILS